MQKVKFSGAMVLAIQLFNKIKEMKKENEKKKKKKKKKKEKGGGGGEEEVYV